MGSNSSKFKKYIQNGDEYAAMQILQGSADIRKTFDPNLSFGEGRNHNTAMHYAARHGGSGSGGSGGENSGSPPSPGPGPALTLSAQERRAACVALLLQWRGARLPASEERERVQIDAQDRDGSSALQLAASAGLAGGCRLLLAAGAKCLPRDARGRTAAQRALAAGHVRLAALLQRAMLFSEEAVEWCLPRWGWSGMELGEQRAEEALGAAGAEPHEGLRPPQLREAKDRLLVDTSDMLRVPLFTAEALLRDNEWCKDVLVEKWMKDAAACCQSAGVSLPGGSLDSEHPEEVIPADGEQKTIECGICCEEVPLGESGGGACGHLFCTTCWSRYLSGRVRGGDARPACPAPRCRRPAPPHLLQRCLSPDTQRKYLLFDIEAFVESSRGMKWCPIAGCGRAVRLLDPELSIPQIPAPAEGEEVTPSSGYPQVSRGVDCGDFHFFCWECNGEAHAPLGCAAWARWMSRAGTAPPAPLAAAVGGAESAASSLWLLAHCKPCPSCACPIQKNDGCNHMKCTKCKFDFCWVCLESWKRHGSATGGYFRCTREEAAARADQSRGVALAEARVQNVEAQEQWRFAVQCARFRRHEQRWTAERPLLAATPAKSRALDPAGAGGGALEGAARELALCRRVLAGACAYTFVLPATAPHRAAFHYAQEELERCASRLAALVAREVVEAPLLGLRRSAAAARRWRLALLRLARPPPPPPPLSAQELRLMARLLARGRLDPRDPWRFPLGPRGEPLRVPDPLDPDHTILQEPQLTVSPRPASDRSAGSTEADVYRINVSEYNMDLIIALEMSRLQMLEEQARGGRTPDTDNSPTSQDGTLNRSRQRQARLNISVSIGAPSDYEDKLSLSDDQLKLAIQLSLQEPVSRLRAAGEVAKEAPGGSGSSQQGDPPSTGTSSTFRTTRQRQEENWSRAADITVGYFLQALGGAPLDLPNLALGLDLLQQNLPSREPGGVEDDSASSHTREDQEAAGSSSGASELLNYCNEGGRANRPPLLRWGCAVTGQRPPLLRQIGGRARRSWSMGDISIRSSSTDDTNPYNKMDDGSNGNESGQDTRLLNPPYHNVDASTLPHPHKSSDRNAQYTITKNIQIDAYTQQCDVNYDIVKNPRPSTSTPEHHKTNTETTKSSNSSNKEDVSKRKMQCYPKNLPWGEFCCEKKCVKTQHQSPTKYAKNSKPNIQLPETDSATSISVDCRGKIDPEVFDFSEKTIHLPDLNSSHLKVNTYLTKLSLDRRCGKLGDGMLNLNQNEIIGDNFRRHSDHIPRVERGQEKVKASSSEKHIGERINVRNSSSVDSNSEKVVAHSRAVEKDSKTDSPKKATKMEKNIPTLSIKICEASQEESTEESVVKIRRGLETDSSNECESETGIPKSPTLYISGVSICRETSPKVSIAAIHATNSDNAVSRSSSSGQYFSAVSRTDSFRMTAQTSGSNEQQKSPKVRQKLAWKDYKDSSNIVPASPVIVHVTSPSLSPCSERNALETMSRNSSYSPELYTPSLLRSTTPTGLPCHMSSHFSDDSINIMDLPVMPPSHFSDDVFLDDDPGLMMDCISENSNTRQDATHPCTLRGTVYAGCHSGGIMISSMSNIGAVNTLECSPSKKTSSSRSSNSEEAVYENIYPQSVINDQLAFEMSLPNSPTGVSISSPTTLQKSWSARPLVNPQEFTAEETQANLKLKSKSANEPERDREMFHFPKSSTDGALSSVLHVQESNLSSDDFHEALFLLERSPKTRDSKRRKRSKKRDKNVDKDGNKKDRESVAKLEVKGVDEVAICGCEDDKSDKKEDVATACCTIENDSPSIEQDEASSAL